jgi:hypothetical protein
MKCKKGVESIPMIRAGRVSVSVAVLLLLLGSGGETMQAQSAPAVTLWDLGTGVRALGMGEAFVGLSDDEQAVLYNPAGLAYLRRLGVNAFYESHFASSDYFGAALGMRRIGLGLSTFNFGGVEQRDESDDVEDTFGYVSFAVVGASAVSLADLPLGTMRGLEAFAFGLRAKYLGVSTLSPGSGGGFGIDPAFLLNFTRVDLAVARAEAIRAGLLLENLISTGTNYAGRSESWPLRLRLGTSVLFEMWTAALDIAVPFEFHLGGEVRLRPLAELGELAIRLGGMVRYGVVSLTLGLGVQVQSFRLDYAFVSHPQLPGSHRLALSWQL